ncbi:MAG: hypothetical protein DRI98_07655 [Bacteroidetes bacterium]|nr:MAG: hypothetical protein DRI98_07655 [Bacteroidota bacterium]
MTTTFYTKFGIAANTVIAGVALLSANINAQPILTTSTDGESAYFAQYSSRYDQLDMAFFRNTMPPETYNLFKSFIGEDSFEILPEDFEPYYPDDEV